MAAPENVRIGRHTREDIVKAESDKFIPQSLTVEVFGRALIMQSFALLTKAQSRRPIPHIAVTWLRHQSMSSYKGTTYEMKRSEGPLFHRHSAVGSRPRIRMEGMWLCVYVC